MLRELRPESKLTIQEMTSLNTFQMGYTKQYDLELEQELQYSSGGILASNETYEVQFKVTVNNPGIGKHVPSILNIARIKALSDADVSFVDDGTAIISPNNGPDNGPLPVTMVSFLLLICRTKK